MSIRLGAVEYLGFFTLPGRELVPLAFGEDRFREGYGHGFAPRQIEKAGQVGWGYHDAGANPKLFLKIDLW